MVSPQFIFKDWFSEVAKDLKKRGPFWSPTLVTGAREARRVVLRSLEFVDTQTQKVPRFIIHTDIRSQKWKDLLKDPSGSLHFYCPKRKWQMRVQFKAELSHQNTDATIEWKRLSSNSKMIYTLPHSPGSIINDPKEAFRFSDLEDGFQNFGVLTLHAHDLESLQLTRPDREDYHVRARWDLNSNESHYLAP